MQSRRHFIRISSLGLPLLGLRKKFKSRQDNGPVVVATWDSGAPVAQAAWKILKNPEGHALDAVESGAIHIESEISCCVGLGGNPDRDGIVTLDACIMDHQYNCGAVAGLERIKHPISVARRVMENTPHVLLVGKGAQQFAVQEGFELEPQVLSKDADEAYREWLKDSNYSPVINIEQSQLKKGDSKRGPAAPSRLKGGAFNHDTMGLIAMDHQGRLAGACTTNGTAFKMRGRVGDSPIIGSGLYVDKEAGAVVATGQGEEVIRTSGSHLIAEFMRNGASPTEACQKAIERIIKIDRAKAKDFQVAYIALDRHGNYGGFCIHPGFTFAVHDSEGLKELTPESYFA